MGPIVIYYHVNTIGREFNWTRKDCPQMRTLGYKAPQTGANRSSVGFDSVYVGKVGWRQSTHNLLRADIGMQSCDR